MKMFLILCGLVVSQIACSADESVLHVRYREKTDLNRQVEAHKKICIEVMKREFKILGDASLLGASMKDEYWSTSGFHAIYDMDYTFKPVSKGDICQLRVVPKMTVSYGDFHKKLEYRYERKYQNWSEASEDPWYALEGLKRQGVSGDVQGDVQNEYLSLKRMPEGISSEMIAAMVSVGWKPLVIGGKFAGTDKVEGLTCTIYKPEIFSNDDTVCIWEPNIAGLPEKVTLKGNINLSNDLKRDSVAIKVGLNAPVPANLLRPPAVWQNKAIGHYEKSKKTNDEWMGNKQLRALRKEKQSKK